MSTNGLRQKREEGSREMTQAVTCLSHSIRTTEVRFPEPIEVWHSSVLTLTGRGRSLSSLARQSYGRSESQVQ